MQIQLSESAQQILSARAIAQGRTLPEYAAGLLSKYAQAAEHPLTQAPPFEIKTHEDAVAWILSRNPDLESNHPEETDWQQLKSQGRSF